MKERKSSENVKKNRETLNDNDTTTQGATSISFANNIKSRYIREYIARKFKAPHSGLSWFIMSSKLSKSNNNLFTLHTLKGK